MVSPSSALFEAPMGTQLTGQGLFPCDLSSPPSLHLPVQYLPDLCSGKARPGDFTHSPWDQGFRSQGGEPSDNQHSLALPLIPTGTQGARVMERVRQASWDCYLGAFMNHTWAHLARPGEGGGGGQVSRENWGWE
jgi:hypothetical protein